VEVGVRVGAAGHLHQTDPIIWVGWHSNSLSSLPTKTYTPALFQDREKAQAASGPRLGFYTQIRYASPSILFKNQDGCCDHRRPEAELVANGRLSDVGCADDLV